MTEGAAGNGVLIKPGNYAAHASAAMLALIKKYLDPECIQCVHGDRTVTHRFTLVPWVSTVRSTAAAAFESL